MGEIFAIDNFSELFFINNSLQQQLEQEQKKHPPQPGSRNLPPTPDTQRLVAEINALKQRLQETGARSENELEQWRKVVEQEKMRADQAEKAAQELMKRTQALEKVISIFFPS